MAKITKIIVLEAQAYVHSWSAVMSPNKPFQFPLKIQSLPIYHFLMSNLYFGTLFPVPCTANPLFFSLLHYMYEQ